MQTRQGIYFHKKFFSSLTFVFVGFILDRSGGNVRCAQKKKKLPLFLVVFRFILFASPTKSVASM